ncbi:MAG: lytic transglycosylase domain-containing protein [Pseudobdellovibrionaceae bacterium]
MKKINLKKGLFVATATLMLALFNNFAFFKWSQPAVLTIESVNEASRISHAKELLGMHYQKSDARGFEGQTALGSMIHRNVQNSLSPKWKAHASNITRTIIRESTKYSLDPVFVLAVIKTESKFNPLAVGRFGEIGLMQIKPDTAKWIAKKYKIPWKGKTTLREPSANIRIGIAYMNYLRTEFNGKAHKYVSAYNMGPRNVRRLLGKHMKPAEYSSRVMKNYTDLYSAFARPEEESSLVVATRS